jgi:hypothetical protein
MQLRVCNNALSWANNAGYKHQPVQCSEFVSSARSNPLTTTIPTIVKSVEIIDAAESEPTSEIFADDIQVIAWNWNPASDSGRYYKYFIISRAGEILCSDPSSSDFWLKYFPIFSSDGSQTVQLQLPDHCACFQLVDYRYTLALGGTHFGHWVADTVPFFLLGDHLRYTDPYLFTNQTSVERSFLSRLCVGSSAGIAVKLKGIRVALIKISKSRLHVNFSVRQRNQLLRSRISRVLALGEDSNRKRVCYLVRGLVDGYRRIANESDLISIMSELGSDIINPSNYPLYDLPNIFLNYSHFVYLNSSINTNFNLLSNDNSQALALLTSDYAMPSDDLILGAGVYMTPRIDQITPTIVAKPFAQEEPHKSFEIDINAVSSDLVSFLEP